MFCSGWQVDGVRKAGCRARRSFHCAPTAARPIEPDHADLEQVHAGSLRFHAVGGETPDQLPEP